MFQTEGPLSRSCAWQTDRQTDRQTDGHADRDRQTDRRTDRSNEETVRSSRRCRSSWPHTTSHDELTRRHDNGIHRRHRRRDDDDILRLIRQVAARAADTPTLTATQCLYEFITSDYSQSQTVYVTSCRRQDQTLHDHLHHCITLITEHYSINPQTLTAAKINPRQDDVSFGYKTVKQLSNMATGSETTSKYIALEINNQRLKFKHIFSQLWRPLNRK